MKAAIWIFVLAGVLGLPDVSHGIERVGSFPLALDYELTTVGGPPDEHLPLLVLFHGAGSDASQFSHIAASLGGKWHVLAFRAPFPLRNGYNWGRVGESGDKDRETLKQVAVSVVDAIGKLKGKMRIIGRPNLLGYSSGARLAYYLGVAHGGNFDKVFSICGYLDKPYWEGVSGSTAAKQIKVFSSPEDQRLDIGFMRDTVKTLKSKGVNIELIEFSGGHQITQDVLKGIRSRL